ncbi:MAG: DoxX family membrane protein [Xanthomonadales bacterium]|nr:DoxX family membrane protein [Xanthomonadales bacterium]
MNTQTNISKWQYGWLVTLRFLIGWHLLYEGIFKFLKPEWSSYGFLDGSQWVLAGVADWITSSSAVLNVVDQLNTWGLIAIGLGLILGLFTRAAAIAGAILLGLYYLFYPPLVGLTPSAPMEGNYLIVNKNLIEAAMLALIAVSPAARMYGLDSLFARKVTS